MVYTFNIHNYRGEDLLWIKNKLIIRKILRPLLRCMLRIQRKFNHFHVELLNEIKYTNKAVIYAVTHIGK